MKAIFKSAISVLVILSLINNAFSQTVYQDTLLARSYLETADKLIKEYKFDNSSEYIRKAENIYSKYSLNKDLLRCELKKSEIYSGKNDLNKALEILKTGKQKALSLFGENSALYADFCDKTGLVYLYAKKYSEARNLQIKALGIRKKLYGNNNIKVSDSYNNLALLYYQTGDYFKSLKLYQNALNIRKKILPEDDLKIASSLLNIGRAFLKTGNPDFAAESFSESMKIKKKKLNPYSRELATLYTNSGAAYRMSGDYEKSLTNYENALRITLHNSGENNTETAGLYASTANLLNLTGQYDKASEYNQKALKIFEEKYGENHPTIAKVLISIGSVYLNQNNIKEAVANFNNSLEISKKLYETWNLKTAEQYTKIGLIFNKKSKNNAALSYFNNALTIQQNVLKSDNYPEIAETYLNIGNAYKDDKEYYSAIENYNKSLAVRLKVSGNKHPETAKVYFLTASAYKIKKDYNSELKNLQKALISNVENFNSQDISRNPRLNDETDFYYNQKLLSETLIEKAEALRNLYLRTNNTDFLKKAADVYEISDLLTEKIKKTALLKEDKKYLEEKISEIYERATALCMQLYKKTNDSEYFNKAFLYAEKNKAGILLFLPQPTKYAGMNDSLLNVETNLLSDIAYFRMKMSENSNDTKSKRKLLALYGKHKSFISDVKYNCPRYYELKYKSFSASVKNIQNLISDSTLVTDYFSPESSKYIYVFFIGKNKIDVHFIKNVDNLNNKITNFRNNLTSLDESSVSAYIKEGYTLYEDLFPGTLKNDTSIKQLIIIPDGIIGTIPFESLLTEEYFGNRNKFEDYPYLIKKYAVSYSEPPYLFRKESYNFSYENSDSLYTDDWLGVAPVFDNANTNTISEKTRNILKKIQNTFQFNSRTNLLSGNNISYMPESEKEVTAIYNEFENFEKSPETDIREEADEEFIKLIDSEEFKYIHIASHAFINAEEPDLSGILFAHNYSDENDGVLYVNEIYNLNFNSDLIVLSACETGFGKYKRNESIAGFTKALFYTGTKNIILSLWEVSNESTAELMLNFYGNILDENNNLDINYSLQRAKLKLIEGGKYAHPFYWSPFILIEK